jgi:serine protease Do
MRIRILAICLALSLTSTGALWAETELDLPDSLARREEAAMRQAAAAVAPAVVQIQTIGGLERVDEELIAQGPTTGLVISPDGFILSSSFNFVQRPASVLVTFSTGKQASADIVATDHSRMLVLLKAHDVSDLPVPDIAPLEDIHVGQWAIAIGRAFRAEVPNVSVGIVSATSRMAGRAIQTDAAVSMANYGGPLVDIRGRVLGILVPMSAQEGDVAGVEWYDSGIGFAVPLAAIDSPIEAMKQGKNQHAGRLGVSLLPGNPLTAPVELAAARPNSPAGKAGLKKGDRIVGVDGVAIETQQELRRVLGPRYAGEQLMLEIVRGDEKLKRTLTLAGELEVFQHAYLGVLPDRAKASEEDEPSGVRIRMVLPGSPAEVADLRPGDVITHINDEPIESIGDAIDRMNQGVVGDRIALKVRRGDSKLDLPATAGPYQTTLPYLAETFQPDAVNDDSPENKTESKPLKLQLPGFAHQCEAYIPPGADETAPVALVLLLGEPDGIAVSELMALWKPTCDAEGILLAVAAPEKNQTWQAGDQEYCRRLLIRLRANYPVDDRRIVVAGQGRSGDIAYQVGLAGRGLIDGVAVASAALPYWLGVPENEPAVRLAVLSAVDPREQTASVARLGTQKLTAAGYPVTTLAPRADGGLPVDEMGRWIDTLDRF